MNRSLIVIVEGEAALPRGVKQCLHDSGHEVNTTIDVLEVLRHAECEPRGILILTLPADGTCSGLDIAHAIRRKTRTLPVILIPGESSEEIAIAALRAGVTDYLKPPPRP